jgi:acyl-CoA reductase-like NAD-dependent aldehyde dehydrogenase
MSAKSNIVEFQAASAEPTSEETRAQNLFNKQKGYFASDATKTYEWRIDQLDRLTRMLKENFERFAAALRKDFKTTSQENVFEVSATIAGSEAAKSQLKEWMKPVEAPLPFLAASGHKGSGCRCPARARGPLPGQACASHEVKNSEQPAFSRPSGIPKKICNGACQ